MLGQEDATRATTGVALGPRCALGGACHAILKAVPAWLIGLSTGSRAPAAPAPPPGLAGGASGAVLSRPGPVDLNCCGARARIGSRAVPTGATG
jgi:hypothetical protein